MEEKYFFVKASTIKTIADSTRKRGRTTNPIPLLKMGETIENIKPLLQSKKIYKNGNVTADSEYEGLDKVEVDVAFENGKVIEPYGGGYVLENLPGYDGETFLLQDKTVVPTTQDQEVIADDEYDALRKVIVKGISSSVSVKYNGEGGFVTDDDLETDGESTQTLTIINSNNPNETVAFTMPSGYTFIDFIGSTYDTSGGKLVESDGYPKPDTGNPICYDGYLLKSDSSDDYILLGDVASGTFYYAGNSATEITDLTGTTWFYDKYLSSWETGSSTTYSINFSSNNQTFTEIIYSKDGQQITYKNNEGTVLARRWGSTTLTNGWTNENYRLLKITGGVDATNTSLIYHLKSGAKQIITFTIDGVSYQALSGMTWGEWVESEYNTGGYSNHENLDTIQLNNNYIVYDSENSSVSKSEQIIDGYSYIQGKWGYGGGGSN